MHLEGLTQDELVTTRSRDVFSWLGMARIIIMNLPDELSMRQMPLS